MSLLCDPCGSHAQSSCVDQLKNLCHHNSSYRHVLCSYCWSFDHNVKFCPYNDVPNELYSSLNAMTETTNEQHKYVVSEMKEFRLLHETDPSLPLRRLKVSLVIDSETSFPLESNFGDNASLIDMEEMFDLSLTFLTFP